jgi:hypothetical protein
MGLNLSSQSVHKTRYTSALLTVEYLDERAQQGSREKFEEALRTVPDVEPEAFDRLPTKRSAKQPSPKGRGSENDSLTR